jgi:hypothetical protein
MQSEWEYFFKFSNTKLQISDSKYLPAFVMYHP